MEIQLVTQFSKKHFEAMTLREQVLDSKIDLKAEKKMTVFAAIEKDKVIGTAAIQMYLFKFARIRQVAVASEYQGKNIGNQLMNRCEDFARDMLHSKVILTGRKTAGLFYLKRDYQIVLFPFKKHGINFFWMVKNVNEANEVAYTT